jgi:ribonuclease P/MRP protein subunit POP8
MTAPTEEVPNPSSKVRAKAQKACEIQTCAIREPPFSYAVAELVTDSITKAAALDNLQVRAYLTTALTRFLGATGEAIPIDILKVQAPRFWLRLPSQDLAAFAAAITAWRGGTEDGINYAFRLRHCSDWLGAMVGRDDQDDLWTS